MNTYRFCDNVWTFMLKDVEFRDYAEINKVDRVKIGRTTFQDNLAHPFHTLYIQYLTNGLKPLLLGILHI